MGFSHSSLMSSGGDTSIKKLALVNSMVSGNATPGRGYLMNPLKPNPKITPIQQGSPTQDDIQHLTADVKPTTGNFRIASGSLKTAFMAGSWSTTQIQNAINAVFSVDVTVTGGPLGDAPIVITTPTASQVPFKVIEDTTVVVPYKWVPSTGLTEFLEVTSNSLYTTVGINSIQAIWLSKAAASGTVTVRLLGINITVPYNCTAAQFKAAMAPFGINVLNYDVYGGPWPKPIVIEWKNSIRYTNQLVFSIAGASLGDNTIQVPVVGIGKQILVSYHQALGKHIVVRPGYF